MNTSINIGKVKPIQSVAIRTNLRQRFLQYCDDQMPQRTLWYLIPLISLSAAVMPIGIFMMSYFPNLYLAFVAVSVLSFFSNLVVNIAGLHTRVTISVYILTLVIHFLTPLVSYLLT